MRKLGAQNVKGQSQNERQIFKRDILDHPLYIPDFAPSYFLLFLHLEKYLAGKNFGDDD